MISLNLQEGKKEYENCGRYKCFNLRCVFWWIPQKDSQFYSQWKNNSLCSSEIINEYEEIVQEMIDRKQGRINRTILIPLIKTMEIIEPSSHIAICRDPDDDKFLECAKDSYDIYIVSGDKDLLVIEKYENIQIVTAKDFCEKYLPD